MLPYNMENSYFNYCEQRHNSGNNGYSGVNTSFFKTKKYQNFEHVKIFRKLSMHVNMWHKYFLKYFFSFTIILSNCSNLYETCQKCGWSKKEWIWIGPDVNFDKLLSRNADWKYEWMKILCYLPSSE